MKMNMYEYEMNEVFFGEWLKWNKKKSKQRKIEHFHVYIGNCYWSPVL